MAALSSSHLFWLAYSAILVFGTTANVIKDKNHQGDSHHHHHQAKSLAAHHHHSRNSAQKCDLVCPGQPPLALPPNFLQNCTTNNNNNTAKTTQKPTTGKPGNGTTTTTTESGEEGGEEGGEGEEEITEAAGTNATARGHHSRHLKTNNKKKQNQQRNSSKNRRHFRKQKMFLKAHARQELLQHKHLKGRQRLDGCYVVCSDQDKPGNAGEGEDSDDDDEEGGDEEGESDSDGDNYVEGEDTPIEIVYVPPMAGQNRRPVDWYQTNNYAFVEPQPVFGVGFDPFFMEVKHQHIKKRKHKDRKPDVKSQEKRKE